MADTPKRRRKAPAKKKPAETAAPAPAREETTPAPTPERENIWQRSHRVARGW